MTLTAKRVTKVGKKSERKESRAKTTIETATFSIPAGKSPTMAVKLNAAGRALLRRDHGRLPATLTIPQVFPKPGDHTAEDRPPSAAER
jgi:hypothetical protein